MARGFESKDVEFQQAEADRRPHAGRDLSAAERDLAAAWSDVHREMLARAMAALTEQLRQA